MKLKYVDEKQFKADILNIIKKYIILDEYKIFIFGSRVLGTADERSDIDVGIKGKNPIDLSVMSSIKEDIDNLPILYTVDFVDFSNTSNDFQEVALSNIELINNND